MIIFSHSGKSIACGNAMRPRVYMQGPSTCAKHLKMDTTLNTMRDNVRDCGEDAYHMSHRNMIALLALGDHSASNTIKWSVYSHTKLSIQTQQDNTLQSSLPSVFATDFILNYSSIIFSCQHAFPRTHCFHPHWSSTCCTLAP